MPSAIAAAAANVGGASFYLADRRHGNDGQLRRSADAILGVIDRLAAANEEPAGEEREALRIAFLRRGPAVHTTYRDRKATERELQLWLDSVAERTGQIVVDMPQTTSPTRSHEEQQQQQKGAESSARLVSFAGVVPSTARTRSTRHLIPKDDGDDCREDAHDAEASIFEADLRTALSEEEIATLLGTDKSEDTRQRRSGGSGPERGEPRAVFDVLTELRTSVASLRAFGTKILRLGRRLQRRDIAPADFDSSLSAALGNVEGVLTESGTASGVQSLIAAAVKRQAARDALAAARTQREVEGDAAEARGSLAQAARRIARLEETIDSQEGVIESLSVQLRNREWEMNALREEAKKRDAVPPGGNGGEAGRERSEGHGLRLLFSRGTSTSMDGVVGDMDGRAHAAVNTDPPQPTSPPSVPATEAGTPGHRALSRLSFSGHNDATEGGSSPVSVSVTFLNWRRCLFGAGQSMATTPRGGSALRRQPSGTRLGATGTQLIPPAAASRPLVWNQFAVAALVQAFQRQMAAMRRRHNRERFLRAWAGKTLLSMKARVAANAAASEAALAEKTREGVVREAIARETALAEAAAVAADPARQSDEVRLLTNTAVLMASRLRDTHAELRKAADERFALAAQLDALRRSIDQAAMSSDAADVVAVKSPASATPAEALARDGDGTTATAIVASEEPATGTNAKGRDVPASLLPPRSAAPFAGGLSEVDAARVRGLPGRFAEALATVARSGRALHARVLRKAGLTNIAVQRALDDPMATGALFGVPLQPPPATLPSPYGGEGPSALGIALNPLSASAGKGSSVASPFALSSVASPPSAARTPHATTTTPSWNPDGAFHPSPALLAAFASDRALLAATEELCGATLASLRAVDDPAASAAADAAEFLLSRSDAAHALLDETAQRIAVEAGRARKAAKADAAASAREALALRRGHGGGGDALARTTTLASPRQARGGGGDARRAASPEARRKVSPHFDGVDVLPPSVRHDYNTDILVAPARRSSEVADTAAAAAIMRNRRVSTEATPVRSTGAYVPRFSGPKPTPAPAAVAAKAAVLPSITFEEPESHSASIAGGEATCLSRSSAERPSPLEAASLQERRGTGTFSATFKGPVALSTPSNTDDEAAAAAAADTAADNAERVATALLATIRSGATGLSNTGRSAASDHSPRAPSLTRMTSGTATATGNAAGEAALQAVLEEALFEATGRVLSLTPTRASSSRENSGAESETDGRRPAKRAVSPGKRHGEHRKGCARPTVTNLSDDGLGSLDEDEDGTSFEHDEEDGALRRGHDARGAARFRRFRAHRQRRTRQTHDQSVQCGPEDVPGDDAVATTLWSPETRGGARAGGTTKSVTAAPERLGRGSPMVTDAPSSAHFNVIVQTASHAAIQAPYRAVSVRAPNAGSEPAGAAAAAAAPQADASVLPARPPTATAVLAGGATFSASRTAAAAAAAPRRRPLSARLPPTHSQPAGFLVTTTLTPRGLDERRPLPAAPPVLLSRPQPFRVPVPPPPPVNSDP